jgi:hypothetical protein
MKAVARRKIWEFCAIVAFAAGAVTAAWRTDVAGAATDVTSTIAGFD